MTTIVSSTITAINVQVDGRRWVQEAHVDSLGITYVRAYLTTAGADIDAALAAYAVQLLSDVKAAEIERNVAQVISFGSLAATTINYSSAAENFAMARGVYLTSTQIQAIMLGDFLSSLSNGILQTAFGLTSGQVNTLRTNKLTPAANAAATIRATTGQ